MPVIEVRTRDGTRLDVTADPGISVMEALRSAGVGDIVALCGGGCSCATCHVYVDPNFASRFGVPSSDEDDLLSASDYRKPTSRLACQLMMSPGFERLAIEIAPED